MELTELKDKIISSFTGNEKDLEGILNLIEEDQSVFPFNEYELLITTLIEKKGLTYRQYLEIRQDYISKNPYLWLFELAGKTFGGTMELYFQAMCSDLKKPSKTLDASYGGEYDFWLDGIKIEVKAGRALDKNSKESWFKKALSLNTEKNFDVILEQIKPNCCDVVVFIAAFRNDILLWILNSKEVVELPTYSAKQHRGNTGEGQFHIKQTNIKLLDKYKFTGKNLKSAIEKAAKREKKTTNKNKK